MLLIDKIEIKNFRSFNNRKGEIKQIKNVNHLNIFSGGNDSGKSNILRALNLFFNGKIDNDNFLNFSNDFYFKEKLDDKDIKEDTITIKIWFNNIKNKGKNSSSSNEIYLPEKFWITRKWDKNSNFSSYKQVTGIDNSIKQENELIFNSHYDKNNNKFHHRIEANLSKQLTNFLKSIYFHYIPAIKDKDYFTFLYSELQKTLWKEKISTINTNQKNLQKSIQDATQKLMEEFEKSIKNNSYGKESKALFKMSENLSNFFKSFEVKTGDIDLLYRGDGVQAKLIPEILNFIAIKELSYKPRQLNVGEKAKKYFIWAFEEPENSYEYKNANDLANKLKEIYSINSQIFISTHSFNFLSLDGENISKYRVKKDVNGSTQVKRVFKNKQGKLNIEGNNDDYSEMENDLGVFELNEDLLRMYKEKEIERNNYINSVENVRKILNDLSNKYILCENLNSDVYNSIGINGYIFEGLSDKRTIFESCKNKGTIKNYFGLIDRDFLLDTEKENIENSTNIKILNYYCFENYLYHPDNLEEYYKNNNLIFDKSKYISSIISEVKKITSDGTLQIKNISGGRQGYKNIFDTLGLKEINAEITILDTIKTFDIENIFKFISMKDYCKQLDYRKNISKDDLSKTSFFKESIQKIVN